MNTTLIDTTSIITTLKVHFFDNIRSLRTHIYDILTDA